MIAEKAYAKINLTLSVGEKREDGYHEIDSVMHSISLCDEVTLTEAGGISLSIKEGFAPGGESKSHVGSGGIIFQRNRIFRRCPHGTGEADSVGSGYGRRFL